MTEQLRLPIGDLTFDAIADGPESGQPVLLLHGFPESGWCWRHVQPRLAANGYRVVAPDLRGYSPDANPPEPEVFAIETLVADVLGLADALGWASFHLVGHDWGGALAWHVAGRHPDRLQTLSVVSTPHPRAFLAAKHGGPSADGDDQAERSSYMRVFREPGSEDLLLADDCAALRVALEAAGLDVESIVHHLGRLADPVAMVGALNWYRGANPNDAAGMGPITTPTLYVWSTDDLALGRAAAEATGAEVDGPYQFVELAGVSHWIPEEAPDALTHALLAHLSNNLTPT
jgi:pimeloyl-ACP methyl ester carboxylesterase